MRACQLLVTATALLVPLTLAGQANASCTFSHGDPIAGYVGPLKASMYCRYAQGAEETWTADKGTTSADFYLAGSDFYPQGGGLVSATLPVTPEETLVLVMGGNGDATSVSREGTPLLVAGGGNGKEPDYVFPGAQPLASPSPGLPPYSGGDGAVYVTWQYGWYEEEKPKPPVSGLVPPPASAERVATERCTVPNLLGIRPLPARRRLAAAHCATGPLTGRLARVARRGRVVSQSLTAGLLLPAGTAVGFVVGRRR